MKRNYFILHSVTSLLVFLFFIIITGCSRKLYFKQSTVVPAAEGSVKIKKDRNDNYNIDVSVVRLANPERLHPPKKTYVVWMETKDNGIKNIGKINSSTSLFSKTLKASLNTITSFHPKKFFITAEEDGAIQHPGSQVVLSTKTIK